MPGLPLGWPDMRICFDDAFFSLDLKNERHAEIHSRMMELWPMVHEELWQRQIEKAKGSSLPDDHEKAIELSLETADYLDDFGIDSGLWEIVNDLSNRAGRNKILAETPIEQNHWAEIAKILTKLFAIFLTRPASKDELREIAELLRKRARAIGTDAAEREPITETTTAQSQEERDDDNERKQRGVKLRLGGKTWPEVAFELDGIEGTANAVKQEITRYAESMGVELPKGKPGRRAKK